MDHNWPKVDLYWEVIVDPKAEKLYEEVIRLLDDLSDHRNWTKYAIGGHCDPVQVHEYYPMRDSLPWIDAGRVRELFERYVKAVTKVRRPKCRPK